MGHGKRPRSAEKGCSPPRVKQSKLESPSPPTNNNNQTEQVIVSGVETYNRFWPLYGQGELEKPVDPEGDGSHREAPLPDTLITPSPSLKQDASGQTAHESVPDQIQLVIRTLSYIFKQLEGISLSLNKLSQALLTHPSSSTELSNLHQSPVQLVSALKRQHDQKSHLKGSRSRLPLPQRNKQSLIFQPNKICLSIFSRDAPRLRWNNLRMAKGYLRDLLNIPFFQIDLISVVPLNATPWPRKFMLSFQSARVPHLLARQKDQLAAWEIVTTRVFKDTSVKPLFANFLTDNECSLPPSVPIIKEKTPSRVPPVPPAIPSAHLVTLRNDPIASGDWNIPEERNLISSYGKLPSEEQQAILDRLDLLKQRLLSLGDPFMPTREESRRSTSHKASPSNALISFQPATLLPPTDLNQQSPVDQQHHSTVEEVDKLNTPVSDLMSNQNMEVDESFASMPELESTLSEDHQEMIMHAPSPRSRPSIHLRDNSSPSAQQLQVMAGTPLSATLVKTDNSDGSTSIAHQRPTTTHLNEQHPTSPTLPNSSSPAKPSLPVNVTKSWIRPTQKKTLSAQTKITDFFMGPPPTSKNLLNNSK